MMNERDFCGRILDRHFNKLLVMTEKILKTLKTLLNAGFVKKLYKKEGINEKIIFILLGNREA